MRARKLPRIEKESQRRISLAELRVREEFIFQVSVEPIKVEMSDELFMFHVYYWGIFPFEFFARKTIRWLLECVNFFEIIKDKLEMTDLI